MKIGYVRVSKQEQHEALQIDALKKVSIGSNSDFIAYVHNSSILESPRVSQNRIIPKFTTPGKTALCTVFHQIESASIAQGLYAV